MVQDSTVGAMIPELFDHELAELADNEQYYELSELPDYSVLSPSSKKKVNLDEHQEVLASFAFYLQAATRLGSCCLVLWFVSVSAA